LKTHTTYMTFNTTLFYCEFDGGRSKRLVKAMGE